MRVCARFHISEREIRESETPERIKEVENAGMCVNHSFSFISFFFKMPPLRRRPSSRPCPSSASPALSASSSPSILPPASMAGGRAGWPAIRGRARRRGRAPKSRPSSVPSSPSARISPPRSGASKRRRERFLPLPRSRVRPRRSPGEAPRPSWPRCRAAAAVSKTALREGRPPWLPHTARAALKKVPAPPFFFFPYFF